MPTDEEETTVPPERLESERPEFPTFCVSWGCSPSSCARSLCTSFVAEYLDETAVAAADHALVRTLRVAAGACAISGFAIGVFVLTRRDEAIMRAQQAARDEQRPSV